MIIGALRVVLEIPSSHSLKDKRAAIRPILARLRHRFDVSTAEVEEQDRWGIAVIGVVYVTSDVRHVDEVLARVVHAIDAQGGEAVLAGYSTEIVHVL